MKARVIVGALLGVVVAFYLGFVNYTDQYHVGIAWNLFSGGLTLQKKAGFHLSSPWVLVSRVDTRPTRVCITSTSRAYNCKLVQFEPEAYREFVATQGFRYYWWANRLSFNFGYDEEYRGMRDILRGYAFGVEQYPFLKVLDGYAGPP